MSNEFIIRTVLEVILVILLIVGLIREKRMIRYEQQIHYRLSELVNQFRDTLAYLCGKHK